MLLAKVLKQYREPVQQGPEYWEIERKRGRKLKREGLSDVAGPASLPCCYKQV